LFRERVTTRDKIASDSFDQRRRSFFTNLKNIARFKRFLVRKLKAEILTPLILALACKTFNLEIGYHIDFILSDYHFILILFEHRVFLSKIIIINRIQYILCNISHFRFPIRNVALATLILTY